LYGWREVCVAFAGLVIVVALPAACLMLRASPEPRAQRRSATSSVGYVVGSAMREPRMWILVGFALLTGLVLVGNVTTLVPLLQSRGEALVDAAKYQSILGMSLVFRRLAGGALLDRVFAPRVVTGILMLTSIGFLVLHAASSPAAYVLAAIGIGLAARGGMDASSLRYVQQRVTCFVGSHLCARFAYVRPAPLPSANVKPIFFSVGQQSRKAAMAVPAAIPMIQRSPISRQRIR
jgi:hypothetical protein